MFPFRKHRARRERIRERIREPRTDLAGARARAVPRSDILISLLIAAAFCGVAILTVMLRENVVRYRPGQYAPQDILSRVDFTFSDQNRYLQLQQQRRDETPRVYKSSGIDVWKRLQDDLDRLPERLVGKTLEELAPDLKDPLQLNETGALAQFQNYARPDRIETYHQTVAQFVQSLKNSAGERSEVIILRDDQRKADLEPERWIMLPAGQRLKAADQTYSTSDAGFRNMVAKRAEVFLIPLPSKIAAFTCNTLQPTHLLDEVATTAARNSAADMVPPSAANIEFKRTQVIVQRDRMISEWDWQVLRQEQAVFVTSLGWRAWKGKLGLAGVVVAMTVALGAYVARYQPRVIRNHARGAAIAALLYLMLLLSMLAAIGTGPLYVFGVAPTIMVAMIMIIAYDQRFALGIASIQAVLVTASLDQGIGFFLILWVGVLTCCFLLNDLRTRSKPIEVGGAAAVAMIAATIITGGISFDPMAYIGKNCLAVGAAGLGVGFIVLGILPFIERAFRITTSMTLLELADLGQPLLRRLAQEAPGTYNHSVTSATLAETAAEAIGANSLLCRVGCYYHDIGKMAKGDYFVENQSDGVNRHINLSPNVSLLIIIGHVKDGVEMAKEYNLPTILFPFIQQHHGTMLVEYFYHRACKELDPNDPNQPAISDSQFRYPGPKPRLREVAIVMLADAVESAARAMVDPNPSRVETLVHELAMKRLLDGQFDECALTFRELEQIERSMAKTLMGIYHQRITYPSTAAHTNPAAAPAEPAVRSA